jgi:AraC-like DNA-binding protein
MPELEYVDRADESIRYLEHGWPTNLCRWHSHEEYELHLILETQGKTFVGDYIGEFGPGSLFLIGPHLPHNWITDEFGKPLTIQVRDMLVQFNQVSIDHLQSAFPEFKECDEMLKRSNAGIEFINFDAELARHHLAGIRDSKGSDRIIKFLSFLSLVSKHPDQKRLSVADIAYPDFKAKKANIAEVVDYIVENFAEDISLESAAKMSNLSPTAFARNFQKLTGSRFTEFVIRVHIGQACSMLQATHQKIATICHEVGFRNLANFNRHFLRIKNTTPSAYRETIRSELLTTRASKYE